MKEKIKDKKKKKKKKKKKDNSENKIKSRQISNDYIMLLFFLMFSQYMKLLFI
jgi:hypothetical protein